VEGEQDVKTTNVPHINKQNTLLKNTLSMNKVSFFSDNLYHSHEGRPLFQMIYAYTLYRMSDKGGSLSGTRSGIKNRRGLSEVPVVVESE
jgi:hypothetical protein